MPIKDYLTTAASNTTIGAINIAEGCNPANINNAIRRLMADIASEDVTTTSVASAATIDLGAQTGSITITGTIAITSFGTAPAGLVRRVWFADATPITHNATSLILRGSADVITAPGDFALFESLGSGNWRMALFMRADGSALGSSGLGAGHFGNPIINGNFDFWQRGTSLTIPAGGSGYLADRWLCYSPNGGTYSRSTDVPSGHLYSLDINAGAGQIIQRIESSIARYYVGKTITVTIQVKKISGTGSLDCQLYYPGATDNWSGATWIATSNFSVNPSTSFTKYSATFSNLLPAQVANGLTIAIIPSASMNYRITGVRVEVGGSTTNFMFRPPALEMLLCQRYYEKSYDENVNPGSASFAGVAFGMTNPGGWISYSIKFNNHKRVTPTMTFYNPNSGAIGSWRDGSGNNGSVGTVWSASGFLGRGGTGIFGSGYAGNVICFGHWVADAEI